MRSPQNIRGILIKYFACIKRERNKQLSQLLQKLAATEARHKHAPTQSSETDLTILRKQITDLLHYRAKAAIQFCCKTTYESGDKCGKLLARMVRDHKLYTYIPHIITTGGRKAVLPTQITQEFKSFYSSLYNLPLVASPQSDMENYITSSQMPSLPQEIGKQN